MNKDLNEQLNNGFMDLGETKKRKLLSSKNTAILFLITGFIIVMMAFFLNAMNNTLSGAVYIPLFMTGMGILLSGILISLLSLMKLFEKVG